MNPLLLKASRYIRGFTRSRLLLIGTIVLLLIPLVIHYSYRNSPEEVPLNTIVEKVKQEQVESITVRGSDLEIVLNDGTHS